MLLQSDRTPVPRRALAISFASLAIPVAAAFWLPDWTSNGLGMLIWLSALIPAFLLSYYRGLAGVAIALAGGMAVITATQVSVVMFDIADPNWTLLGGIAGVYLAVSVGIGGLSEVLRRERQAAEEMALVDRLTGLPNRRHADIVLEREFAAAERGRDLSVILFDLDRFKGVNDRHGHAAGDQTLKMFAKVLQSNTRREDLSARFGGEEFIAILRDADSKSAVFFAQRVLDQTRQQPLPWGKQTVSAGVAGYEDGMGSYELLLSAADRALYQAKDGGRDMVWVAKQTTERVRPKPKRTPVAATSSSTLPKEASLRMYVVDDDAAVRNVMKRVLIASGHTVWDTGDPREAIAHYADTLAAERPEVILTDVMMPQMSGMRMIDEIARLNPDVRVIYMSGYVQSKIEWTGTPGSVVAFLEKPISLDALRAAVTSVATRTGPPPPTP